VLTLPAQGAAPGAAPAAAPTGAPGTAHAAAPYDMTGYWVSEVTEKWRYRMLVPDKGDYVQVHRFGAGIVEAIEDERVTVSFADGERREFLKTYVSRQPPGVARDSIE
jgi:hypothetical protein